MSSPRFERWNVTLVANSIVSGTTRTALVAMVSEAAAASMMPAPRSSQTGPIGSHKASFEVLDLRGVSRHQRCCTPRDGQKDELAWTLHSMRGDNEVAG